MDLLMWQIRKNCSLFITCLLYTSCEGNARNAARVSAHLVAKPREACNRNAERRLIAERAQNRPLAFKGKLLGHYKHALPARLGLPLYFFKYLICLTGRRTPENKFKQFSHPIIFYACVNRRQINTHQRGAWLSANAATCKSHFHKLIISHNNKRFLKLTITFFV